MSTLQERPRVAAAAATAIALVVIVAVLIGGAISGGRNTPVPAAASNVGADRARQRVGALEREVTLERGHVREQTSRANSIDQRAQRWRKRALRAERQLKTARRAHARRR